METETLTLTGMAHGGMALGRDRRNRVVFVAGGIPGEKVEVELVETKNRYAQGRLVRIIKRSPHRIDETAGELGPHGGHTLRHVTYKHQLELKHGVVVDQLKRIGGLKTEVKPILPAPKPWSYDHDVVLSPVGGEGSGLGFWSTTEQRVLPAGRCPTLIPRLQSLIADFDLALPDLRQVTLRAGTDDSLLVALEIDEVEPPELAVDFPVSVAIVLPDNTAANLIGFNHITREVEGRPFQITAGCHFHGNVSALPGLIYTVRRYANLKSHQTALELFSGVGLLTRFLADEAAEVIGIEANPDAIADAVTNLDETENVSLYEGWVEEILPNLARAVDTVVMDTPAGGLNGVILEALAALKPRRIIYSGRDIATAARDGKQLGRAGYKLVEVQPIDLLPQTYHIHTVGLWQK